MTLSTLRSFVQAPKSSLRYEALSGFRGPLYVMKLCVRKGRKCSKIFLELKMLILSDIREDSEKYSKKVVK